MKRLVLATTNPGKIREFRRLLVGIPFEVVTPGELGLALEVEETGVSYEENATLKTRAFAKAAGCLALGDDSGIEVDALGGRPGLYSARYGGPGLDDAGRTALLIEEMRTVPDGKRYARYRAVVAVAGADGEARTFAGVCEGTVGHEACGERGFGYDPIFVLGDGRRAGQVTDVEKDAVSHRGQAVRAAAEYLRSLAE